MVQPNTQVYVTNISPSASEKTVTDFFSFCGKINSMTLRTYVAIRSIIGWMD
jgi:RNA recognition motif-containing protein